MGVDEGMPQLEIGEAAVKQRGKGEQAGTMVVTGTKPVLIVTVDGEQLCQIAAFEDAAGSRLATKILARMNARLVAQDARIAELEGRLDESGTLVPSEPASRARDSKLGALVKDEE